MPVPPRQRQGHQVIGEPVRWRIVVMLRDPAQAAGQEKFGAPVAEVDRLAAHADGLPRRYQPRQRSGPFMPGENISIDARTTALLVMLIDPPRGETGAPRVCVRVLVHRGAPRSVEAI
jgi:hypothetical protein